jgi:hypothetical protein
VDSALQPHVPLPDGHLGYRIVDTGRIRPRLSDLGVEEAWQLEPAIAAWHRAALREWATEGWLAVESIAPILARLQTVERRLRERRRELGVEDVWTLVNAPVDEDSLELLGTLALAVAGDRAQKPVLDWLLDTRRLRDASLEDAEGAGRAASILRWFALQYAGVGGVTIERAAALEQAAAERVVARLRAEVSKPTVGRCRVCGTATAPWFSLCDRCFARR